MAKNNIPDEQGRLVLEVDSAIYSKRAIMEAAFRFTDKCFISIEGQSDTTWNVCIKSKDKDLPKEAIMDISSEFHNELLDRQLRIELEESFKEIREMILRQAFWPRKIKEKDERDIGP